MFLRKVGIFFFSRGYNESSLVIKKVLAQDELSSHSCKTDGNNILMDLYIKNLCTREVELPSMKKKDF